MPSQSCAVLLRVNISHAFAIKQLIDQWYPVTSASGRDGDERSRCRVKVTLSSVLLLQQLPKTIVVRISFISCIASSMTDVSWLISFCLDS